MIEAASQIFYNESLYGHSLISLPSTIWNIATSEDLLLYQKPDPDTAVTVCCLFEKYSAVKERWPNGAIKRMEIATNILPLKYIEIIFRRIVGAILIAGFSLSAVPVGFAIKTIYLLQLHMKNRCSSSHAYGFANCSDSS